MTACLAFAKATDIKVIYSLHALDAAGTAKYIWDNYRPYVDCFAFDNEPDGRALTGGSGAAVDSYSNYIDGWNGVAGVGDQRCAGLEVRRAGCVYRNPGAALRRQRKKTRASSPW